MKIYNVLIEAIDIEGPFFQNFYPYAMSSQDAITKVMDYLCKFNYQDTSIDSIEECKDIEWVNDLVEDDNFEGFIQNVKHAY